MPMTECKVTECKNKKPRRFLMCSACWNKLPGHMTHASALRPVRLKDNKLDQYNLRANPDRDWFIKAMQYVGTIHIPTVLGAGATAIKINDNPN